MRIVLTILLGFTLICNTYAQQDDNQKSPKIGLVLSGGGAKGFAHIGALKVIDSLGIKIDYVAGTSMGAIIGSLYASGYSGREIDSLFKNVDFDEVISDKLPREAKTFYERDQSERYALSIPFDDFEIAVPRSLSRGQNVFNLLSKTMLHVNDIEDFSQLPIPFFCIATNIETGEEVILDSGNLPKAVSASGAFPSLFQPVIIDDKVLLDGGITNNYPINHLKAKGMDIIIGVDVQDGLRDRENLKAATDVLLQINNFRTINDMKKKSALTDIYIQPDIKKYTVISFSEVDNIVDEGEKAAKLKLDALSKLKKSEIPIHEDLKKITAVDSIRFNDIIIKGNDKYTYSYISGKLKIKKGKTTSYYDFNKGVNNLMATNNFDLFDYELVPNGDAFNLIGTIKETENRTFLKLGIHYDDLYKSAALVNLTRNRVLFNNDVASLDFIVGDNVRYNFNYYIDKGFHWSVGLSSRFNHFEKGVTPTLFMEDVNASVNVLNADINDFTNRFFLQTLFKQDFLLTLGLEHKRLKISTETLLNQNSEEDETIFEKSDFISAYGQLKLDSFTDKYFPKRGFLVDCDFHLYLSSSDFNNNFSEFSIAKGNFAFAFGIANRLHAKVGTSGGFKIGNDNTQSLDFALGGYGNNFINNYIPFYGYDFLAIPGNSFVKAYTDIDFELFNKHHLIASINVANVGNDIFEGGEWITTPNFSGYALGYSIDTFLGPIEAKWTFSGETKQSIWVFNVGFWF